MTALLRFLDRRPLWIGLGIATLLVAAVAALFLRGIERDARALQAHAQARMDTLAGEVHDSLMPALKLVESLAPALEVDAARIPHD